jgi:hypothetical protein
MIRRSSASTTNVYGRLKAIRTSAVIERAFLGQANELAIEEENHSGRFTRTMLKLPTPGRASTMQCSISLTCLG